MSLRVLLADESVSIHKVFQMGLQDFATEVKSVHNGLDVAEVAKGYHPDIIFADILLQKKNGYEVAEELQQDPELKDKPVVLMWSSFMELDQGKYQACGAKGDLEKPFEVEKMRKLIQELVPSSQTQKIFPFLEFPASLTSDLVEEEKAKEPGGVKGADQAIERDEVREQVTEQTTELAEQVTEQVEEQITGQMAEPVEEPVEEQTQTQTQAQTQTKGAPLAFPSLVEPPPSPFPLGADEKPIEQPAEPVQAEGVLPFPGLDEPEDQGWQAKTLGDQSLEPVQSLKDQDLENFQSMELGEEAKPHLEDFLYTPGPEPEASSEPTPSPEAMGAEEAEAIIREETRQFLNSLMKKELPQMLEKVVRAELEKILQNELAAGQG